MEEFIIAAPPYVELERVYLLQATLKNFKGKRNVIAHIYRHGADPAELDALRDMKLVADADSNTPEGATAEDALHSVLEAFTADEGNQVLELLRQRYANQIEKVFVFPLDLPIPLGVVPFASLPEEHGMGFIHFDAVRDYALPFRVRAFYDLNAPQPEQDAEKI